MSPEADPDNPNGTYMYVPQVLRDWYDDAVETASKDEKWKDNYSSARKFSAVRVER